MEAGTTRIVVPAFLFGEPFSRRTHLGACTPATAGTQAQLPHQHAGGGEQRAQLRTRRPNRRRYRSIRLSASTSPIRYRPARRGAFSNGDSVGCKASAAPLDGSRPAKASEADPPPTERHHCRPGTRRPLGQAEPVIFDF